MEKQKELIKFITDSDKRINDYISGHTRNFNKSWNKLEKLGNEIIAKYGIALFIKILNDSNYKNSTKYHIALLIKEKEPEIAKKVLYRIWDERGPVGGLAFRMISYMKDKW